MRPKMSLSTWSSFQDAILTVIRKHKHALEPAYLVTILKTLVHVHYAV